MSGGFAGANPFRATQEGLLQKGISLLGYDFRNSTIRTPTTKTIGIDTLPTGATYDGTRIVTLSTGDNCTFNNWDCRGKDFTINNGAIVVFNDCKFSPYFIANEIMIDVYSHNTTATFNYCDFDGLRSQTGTPTVMSRMRGGFVNNTVTYNYCSFHGIPGDATNGSLTAYYCWFYDTGYAAGFHCDFTQIIDGHDVNVSYCLIDGSDYGLPEPMNNCLRLYAEATGAVNNVLCHHNIIVNAGQAAPIILGNRISGGPTLMGTGASNFELHDNWIRKVAAPGYYTQTAGEVPTGYARWYNNLDLDTLATIAAPSGWTGAP